MGEDFYIIYVIWILQVYLHICIIHMKVCMHLCKYMCLSIYYVHTCIYMYTLEGVLTHGVMMALPTEFCTT